jgi:hypothetical protein
VKKKLRKFLFGKKIFLPLQPQNVGKLKVTGNDIVKGT